MNKYAEKLGLVFDERDEWGTPSDLLRSLEEAGLHLVTESERKVLEAMALIQTCDLRAHANERSGWSRAIDSALATELDGRGEKPEAPKTQVIDLFEALKKSLQEAQRGEKP